MGSRQHPAAGLAGEFDEAEVPVEGGGFWRFGINDDGSHGEGLTGGCDTLARIGKKDGA